MGWSSIFSLAERELNVTQREEPHTRHVEQERQAKPSQAKHVAIEVDRTTQVVDRKVYLAEGTQAEGALSPAGKPSGRHDPVE